MPLWKAIILFLAPVLGVIVGIGAWVSCALWLRDAGWSATGMGVLLAPPLALLGFLTVMGARSVQDQHERRNH